MNKAATPKHFEGFIFDLDGTLLNTLPDLVVVTNKALKKKASRHTLKRIFCALWAMV